MSRSFLCLTLALLPFICRAQIQLLPFDTLLLLPSQEQHHVELLAWGDQHSSGIFNEMPWNLHRGGYIGREMRQRSLEALGDRNRMGYDVGASATWIGPDSLFGRARWRPVVAASVRSALGVVFTKDAYDLAFFGNAHYEGRTAELAPAVHLGMGWQGIGVGIQDQISRSFLRVDLVGGRRFDHSRIERGSIYTAMDGLALDVDLDGMYMQSDTATDGAWWPNGVGITLHGRWNLFRQLFGMPATFSASLEDVGFMHWNSNSLMLEKDTLIIYEGIQVSNVFDLPSLIIGEDRILDTLGLQRTRSAFTTMMPFRALLSMDITVNDVWMAGLSVDHRNLPGYMPHGLVRLARRISGRALIGATVSYGGWGQARAGLAARMRFGRTVVAEIGSVHVPGFFLARTRGAGAHFMISKAF